MGRICAIGCWRRVTQGSPCALWRNYRFQELYEKGGELALAAVTAVEGVDAVFFRAVPDPGALLAMQRTLARPGG